MPRGAGFGIRLAHMSEAARRTSPLFCLTMALVIAAGIFLRTWPSAAAKKPGLDEVLYATYAQVFEKVGLLGYESATASYIIRQGRPETLAELPPTRFLYIFSGWLWKRVRFGDAPPVAFSEAGAKQRDPMLVSLRNVSALFTIGLMLVVGAAAGRMAGRGAGLAVGALFAFSPLEIHMSQHALIDGFFTFWAMLALWSLWENLRQPDHPRWLAVYGLSLTAMVLTKENSFFVYLALVGLIGVNRWGRFGEVRRSLLAVSLLAPAFGVAILVALAGGPGNFITTYQLLVSKAQQLPYAIETGDGPWYRYLVDLMLISPVVLCLAIGAVYWATKERVYLYLIAFVGFSYLIMCNVRYGMNLRYATIWDFPLRMLAYAQVCWVIGAGQPENVASRRTGWLLAAIIAALCLYDLCQYYIFFMKMDLYELATEGLLQAVHIFK